MNNCFLEPPLNIKTLFADNTQFTQEQIQSFATEVTRTTEENGEVIITYRSGFRERAVLGNGMAFTGFAWTRIFGPSSYALYKYGIEDRWEIVGFDNCVHFNRNTREEPDDQPLIGNYVINDYDDDLPEALIVKTRKGELAYCGTHRHGKRHGLGSEFVKTDKYIAELQGLWQDDKLTHLKINDRLVPVLKPDCKADAESICSLFDRIAELCKWSTDWKKGFGIGLYEHSNLLMMPYKEDPAVLSRIIDRYSKMAKLSDQEEQSQEYREKIFSLLEQAVESAATVEQKLECGWQLYDKYAEFGHPKKTEALRQFAECCLAHPQVDIDPNRRFIALKSIGCDTEAQAVLDGLMASFDLETNPKSGEYTAGFKHNGRFSGFVWQKRNEFECGIVGEDGSLLTPPSIVLKEIDDDREWTFCGMHCNGIRNGLGTQHYHDYAQHSYLQGLWQDGKLTHIRSGARLIALEGKMCKQDCYDLSKVYKELAQGADYDHELLFYNKAVELRELYKNEETDKNELVVLAEWYKNMEDREEDYIALLNEIMDRFGNDAELAWELYNYLINKYDSRSDQAVERYLDSEGGDPEHAWKLYAVFDEGGDPRLSRALERYLSCEVGIPWKRLKAAAILKRDDIVRAEHLNAFGHQNWRKGGYFGCDLDYDVWGFIVDGKFTGYAWYVIDDQRNERYQKFGCGIVNEEYSYDFDFECSTPRFACHVQYNTDVELFHEAPEDVCVERDQDGKIVFFGMQKDGVRHGLGTEFHWKDGQLDSVFKGYWEKGKLSHRVEDDKLVAINN